MVTVLKQLPHFVAFPARLNSLVKKCKICMNTPKSITNGLKPCPFKTVVLLELIWHAAPLFNGSQSPSLPITPIEIIRGSALLPRGVGLVAVFGIGQWGGVNGHSHAGFAARLVLQPVCFQN